MVDGTLYQLAPERPTKVSVAIQALMGQVAPESAKGNSPKMFEDEGKKI
jgi:hypothetical protein